MPFCRHCGVEHSDVDRFCPSCGRRIERDPTSPTEQPTHVPPAPSPPPPGTRLGAVATLEHALTGMTRNGLWGLAVIALLQTLAISIASALMGLLVLDATFSTFWPRRILRTGCFRPVSGFPVDRATVSWDGRTYELRSGCDPIRPHVDAAGLVLTGVLAVAVIGLVTAAAAIALYRRCDRQAGSGRRWRLLPGPAPLARAAYRQLGWSIVAYAGAVLTIAVAAIPIGATVSTAGGGGGGGLLVVIELIAYAYLAIRWVIPWLVRVYLAWVRMLLDDRPLAIAYSELPDPGIRAAWALVGLCLAIVVAILLVSSIVAGLVPGLQIPIQLIVGAIEAMALGTFAVAAMRNLCGELGRDASAGGGYEYQAGGSEPGAGGSAG